jgi:hypothetical protein
METNEPDQKRARVMERSEQPLEKDEVLDEIFSIVGRKEWLYAGGVCRRWRGRYLTMCFKARASNDEHAFQPSHKSSFVTAARFSLTLNSGLQMPDESEAGKFFNDLPKHSKEPFEVLTLAMAHGAAWHKYYCRDAAYFGDLELLQWLHKSGCPWGALVVAQHAIRGQKGQHELILPWLLSVDEQWSQADKDKLLFEAGVVVNMTALELMLQEGAEWPSSLIGKHCTSTARNERVRVC